MKKMTLLLLIGLGFCSQALFAANSNAQPGSFWDRLRAKIESFTPQKKASATTATGGVRGAPVASEDIYWKSEASPETIAAEELEVFTQAVTLTETSGTEAKAAFSNFIQKYPESPLRKDADQALAHLQATPPPAK